MKDTVITRCPTFVNTEKMGLKELRAQYLILQGDAIDQAQQLSDVCAKLAQMNELAENLSSMLYALCDSYEAGDQAAILLQVKRMSERRAGYCAQKAKVH